MLTQITNSMWFTCFVSGSEQGGFTTTRNQRPGSRVEGRGVCSWQEIWMGRKNGQSSV